MRIKNVLMGLMLSVGFGISWGASAVIINTTYDLNNGLGGTQALDDGAVNIANGDHVGLTVNFADNKALNIKDGGEYLYGWLLAGDNESSFTIENIVFELLGFTGVGGAQSVFNLGTQSSGAAHLGATLNNFLTTGQEVTFSGYKVDYDVVNIAQSPHGYGNVWFIAGSGGGTSIVDATSVPEPSGILLIICGIFALMYKRVKYAK